MLKTPLIKSYQVDKAKGEVKLFLPAISPEIAEVVRRHVHKDIRACGIKNVHASFLYEGTDGTITLQSDHSFLLLSAVNNLMIGRVVELKNGDCIPYAAEKDLKKIYEKLEVHEMQVERGSLVKSHVVDVENGTVTLNLSDLTQEMAARVKQDVQKELKRHSRMVQAEFTQDGKNATITLKSDTFPALVMATSFLLMRVVEKHKGTFIPYTSPKECVAVLTPLLQEANRHHPAMRLIINGFIERAAHSRF